MSRVPCSVVPRSRALAPLVAFVATTSALVSREAAARDVPDAVIASYEASAGCPDRARFVALLRSYLDPQQVPEALPTFTVRFATDGGARGALTMTSPGQAPGERMVEATTCDDAALALAYVAALAISPNARSGSGPPVPVMVVPPSDSSPPPSGPPTTADASGAAAFEPARDRALVFKGPVAPQWSVGLGIFAATGIAPALAPGLSLAADRRVARGAVGLELAAAMRGVDPAGAGSARFSLVAGRAFVCPWSGRPWSRLELAPCGLITAGVIAAQASGLDRTPFSVQPWVTASARARARAWITDTFGVSLTADLGTSLVRPVYRFDEPAASVHRVPALVGEVGLAVVWSFR